MLDDNILEKSEKEYKLNMDWIRQLENELAVIKKNYGPSRKNKKAETTMKDRINNFIAIIGPRVKDYLGDDKCIILSPSGTGQYYGLNLWKYLGREGKDAKYIILDKMDVNSGKKINFKEGDFHNRKVLIVDYGIFSGSIYKMIIDILKPLKKRFKIKDIKCAVDIDLLNLADFSVTSSVENINTGKN
jgi:hypothetical protein